MKHFKRFGFLYILFLLFVGSWVGQWWAMANEAGPFTWVAFWAATFENWQSEFLQLLVQAIGMHVLAHLMFSKSTEDLHRIEKKIDRLLKVDLVLKGNRHGE